MAVEPLILIPCVERCGLTIAAKLPITGVELERILAAKAWYLSVVSAPGDPVVLGVICTGCAKRVYDATILAEMERLRDERLS